VSVDVWFTQDIQQILVAAVRANEEALAAGMLGHDPLRNRSYHQGFRAALSTMALALGLPQLPPADAQEQCLVVDTAIQCGDRPSFALRETENMGQEVPRGNGPALVR
jgi:hypothetical protein